MIIHEGNDILDVLREADEEHFQLSKQRIGTSIDLFHLISGLYDHFSSDYTSSKLNADSKYIAPLTFLLSCQHELVVSTMKAMRGHLVDALQTTRRAIELCAFARRISKHPHLAEIWLEAGRSYELYQKYRKKFPNDKLFPENDHKMAILYERYDTCSKMMHSSVFSVASRLKVQENDKDFEISFNYFEINDDMSEPISTLLFVWDVHALMIRVFTECLSDIVEKTQTIWDMRLNALDASLTVHKSRWKDTIVKKSQLSQEDQ